MTLGALRRLCWKQVFIQSELIATKNGKSVLDDVEPSMMVMINNDGDEDNILTAGRRRSPEFPTIARTVPGYASSTRY